MNGKPYIPPHSLEAEQSLLGALLIDVEAVGRVVETGLSAADFYRSGHQDIFKAALGLYQDREPVDLITLAEALKKSGDMESVGGHGYLSELCDAVGTAANVEHHARIIQSHATRRGLVKIGREIVDHNSNGKAGDINEALERAENAILGLRAGRERKGLERVNIRPTIAQIENRYKNPEAVTGLSTGFHGLDRLTGGLQPSDLIILAGRTSQGKTSLALNIAANIAVESPEPVAVAFFSLEMSTGQLNMRLLSDLARVDLQKIRTGQGLDSEDLRRLVEAAGRIQNAPIYIDDTPAQSGLEIRAKARRLQMAGLKGKDPLGLVIVDYLQLMRGKGETREQAVSEISRSLKALAKELNVPVLALSQLNRNVEARTVKKPTLSDLRESGAIEQDADVVGFVYREEVYKETPTNRGKAELLIRKQRNGPTGDIELRFVHELSSFRNLPAGR